MDMYPPFTQLETRHRENLARARLRTTCAKARRRTTGFLRRLRIGGGGRA